MQGPLTWKCLTRAQVHLPREQLHQLAPCTCQRQTVDQSHLEHSSPGCAAGCLAEITLCVETTCGGESSLRRRTPQQGKSCLPCETSGGNSARQMFVCTGNPASRQGNFHTDIPLRDSWFSPVEKQSQQQSVATTALVFAKTAGSQLRQEDGHQRAHNCCLGQRPAKRQKFLHQDVDTST